MANLPLPLIQDLTITFNANAEKIEFKSAAVFIDIVKTNSRYHSNKSISISTYLPKIYFEALENFMLNYDGKPFDWIGMQWVCQRYQVEFLGRGDRCNVSLDLTQVTNL